MISRAGRTVWSCDACCRGRHGPCSSRGIFVMGKGVDYSPTLVPRSMELSTLIERSGFTLPMIWTPLPAERCASC